MFHTPRANWFILALYSLISIAVLVASLAIPAFRTLAYAPVRELLMPPPAPIVVSLLYSTEKDAWLKEAVPSFEATNPAINGHPVQIKLETMGSREIYLAVLDGSRKPDIISPASSMQIAILQDQSTGKFPTPVVNLADKGSCRSVVTTPLVLVAWKERAAVLWGQQPGNSLWQSLQTAAVDPRGWDAFGHSDWGYLKFGHTSPLSSNSGFMTVLLMTYGYYNKTSGLSSQDILGNPDYQKWFSDFEKSISQFEPSTGPLMQKMVSYGPSVYDLVAVYEATAIEQAQNAVGRYGELHVYYPPATIWSDHPFCILNADWVTPDTHQAAAMFIDYLSSKDAQQVAFMKYGFRPVEPSVSLTQPGSPFVRYTANGLQADLSNLPTVELPTGSVLNTLLDFWNRNFSR